MPGCQGSPRRQAGATTALAGAGKPKQSGGALLGAAAGCQGRNVQPGASRTSSCLHVTAACPNAALPLITPRSSSARRPRPLCLQTVRGAPDTPRPRPRAASHLEAVRHRPLHAPAERRQVRVEAPHQLAVLAGGGRLQHAPKVVHLGVDLPGGGEGERSAGGGGEGSGLT